MLERIYDEPCVRGGQPVRGFFGGLFWGRFRDRRLSREWERTGVRRPRQRSWCQLRPATERRLLELRALERPDIRKPLGGERGCGRRLRYYRPYNPSRPWWASVHPYACLRDLGHGYSSAT